MKQLLPIHDCSKCHNVKKGESIFTDSLNKKLENSFPGKKFLQIKQRDQLYKKNEPVHGTNCIYSGKVRINATRKKEKEITIHCPGKGENIGFNSIIKGKYTTSSKAKEEKCDCLFFISEVQKLIITVSSVTRKNIGKKC